MKRKHAAWRALLFLVAVAALIAGCTTGDDDDDDTGDSDTGDDDTGGDDAGGDGGDIGAPAGSTDSYRVPASPPPGEIEACIAECASECALCWGWCMEMYEGCMEVCYGQLPSPHAFRWCVDFCERNYGEGCRDECDDQRDACIEGCYR